MGISGFMRAMRRATDFTIEHPDAAWKIMTRANPRLDNNLYAKIYQRTLPYFSRDLLNVDRDWEKVGQFCSPSPPAASASTSPSSTQDDQAGGGAQLDAHDRSLRVPSDDDAGANSPSAWAAEIITVSTRTR